MKRRVAAENNNKNLTIISKILTKNNIKFFPFYGTLLGLVRENCCIDGDDDIDIMVNYKDRDKIFSTMKGLGMTNTDGGRNFLQFTYRIGGAPVIADFYLYEEEEDYIVEKWNFFGRERDKNFNIHFDKSEVFPLVEREWKHGTIMVPKESEKLIAHCYGEQWNVKKQKGSEYTHSIVNNKIIIKYK